MHAFRLPLRAASRCCWILPSPLKRSVQYLYADVKQSSGRTLIFLFAPLVHAQTELECPAEIEGHVEFTGSPTVLALLAAQGLNAGFVAGSSVNPPNLGLIGVHPALSG